MTKRRAAGHRRALWLSIGILSFLAACAGDSDEPSGPRVPLPDTAPQLPSATLIIPDGVKLSEQRVGPEARLYSFTLRGRPLFSLYLGPNPTFNPPADAPEVQREIVDGQPAKTVVSQQGDAWSRDMLVPSRHGVFYHFFYHDLSGADLLTADDIIASLQER